MTDFSYRAVDRSGQLHSGNVVAIDRARAVAELRRSGRIPLEIAERAEAVGEARSSRKLKAEARRLISELTILLDAGLPLDRAFALALDNVADAAAAREFAAMLALVKEGGSLSQAMATRPALFSATARAMTEAGEMNGRLPESLGRLSQALEAAEELRLLVVQSMIYPAILLALAVSVILMMLLYVVPQFETLFATAGGQLPSSSLMIMSVSRLLRSQGLVILLGLIVTGFAVRQLLKSPASRAGIDRLVLRVPQLGTIIRNLETARFARTLGVLLEGEVQLPVALGLACRSIGNRTMAAAVADVAGRTKEGEGLARPLASTGMLPRVAIGLLRTGEETSRLPTMLERLANMMDRDVRERIQRLIAVVTPLITILLGASVAGIIASIMTALLGFNDMAVGQ